MIEQTFFSIISGFSSITAQCANRIYPLVIPQDVQLPAIHYFFIASSSKATQDTRGGQRHRVEVNCWGDTYADAVALRTTVITELDQYRADSVFIAWLSNMDLFEHDALQYRCCVEFYVYSNFSA
jgi:hypothetical protein